MSESMHAYGRPVDCSPPGSSDPGIVQARMLERVACPPPGDLPDPGMEPASLMSAGRQAGSRPLHPGRPVGTRYLRFSSVCWVLEREADLSGHKSVRLEPSLEGEEHVSGDPGDKPSLERKG